MTQAGRIGASWCCPATAALRLFPGSRRAFTGGACLGVGRVLGPLRSTRLTAHGSSPVLAITPVCGNCPPETLGLRRKKRRRIKCWSGLKTRIILCQSWHTWPEAWFRSDPLASRLVDRRLCQQLPAGVQPAQDRRRELSHLWAGAMFRRPGAGASLRCEQTPGEDRGPSAPP
jgi:hypothetical protein